MSEHHLHTPAKTDRKLWSAWRRANYSYVQSALASFPDGAILYDLGAGSVPFRDILFRFKYTGVDFVPFPDVTVVADLTKLPIPDDSAEILTIMNTIEHVPDTAALLREAYRIQKPGGTIIGTIPFLMQVHQEPHDYNRYTSAQIERFLTQAGFVEVKIKPLGRLIDVYDTIELKFFAALPGLIGRVVRTWRRLEMRVLRALFRNVPATHVLTEGYGFTAKKSI